MIERLKAEGPGFLAREWPPSALSPVTLRDRPVVVREIERMAAEATAEGAIALQQAMATRADSQPLLPQIDVPTVVVHGEDDPIVPLAEARSMTARIAGARFIAVASAGHVPSMEQPQTVTDALAGLIVR